MRILNSFKKEMNKTAYIYGQTKITNQATGYNEDSDNLKGSVKGFLFVGSAADRLVSEKIRPIVDAVLIVDPIHFTFTISDSDKLIIGSTVYTVIRPDDIGNQGEAMQINLREIT